MLYLNFTVVLFVLGPWPFPVQNSWKLYLYLVFAHAALLMGYLSVRTRQAAGYRGRVTAVRLLTMGAIVSLALLLPTSLYRTGSLIPNVFAGLSDPGYAYSVSSAARTSYTPMIEYVRLVTAPFLAVVTPLTAFYWSRLPLMTRVLSASAILGGVAVFVAMGTNKAIADTVVLIPILVLAGHLSGVSRLSRPWRIALSILAAIALVMCIAFFGKSQSTRSGSSAYYGYLPGPGIPADYENALVRNLAPEMQTTVLGLSSYLTQGYYALSLALDEPFVPMYGVGNSMFLFRQAASVLDRPDILTASYPSRIEQYGWDAYRMWSSIYPWLASDASFPGSILIVFMIGRLFALSWFDTLRGQNPYAVAVFGQLLIMLFYFPANNQCLQTGEGFIAFWVLFLAWISTRTAKGNMKA